MKVLDRYILAQHVPPFFGGLAVLTMVLLLDKIFDLLSLLVKKGVDALTVLELFALSLPWILALTVPMAVLVATLVAYGNFSQNLELLAAQTLGTSLRRSLLAPLLGSAVVAGAMVAFNNTILPEANHRLKNLMIDIHQKKPAAQIRKGVFTKIENFLVYVGGKDDRTSRISDVKIQEIRPDGGLRTILAQRGVVRTVKDKYLVFDLENGSIHETQGRQKEFYRIYEFDHHRVEIPMNAKLIRKERSYRGDREMSAAMLLREVRKAQELLERLKPEDARRRVTESRIDQLLVEFHKKFSIPFASVVFVLVGAPLAALARRGGFGAAFGMSFVIFMVYYLFLIGGEELADRGHLAPWIAMWLPNAVFVALGLFLLRKGEG